MNKSSRCSRGPRRRLVDLLPQVVIVSLFDLEEQAAKALVPLDDLVKCLTKCLHPLSRLIVACIAVTQVLQVISQLLLENDGVFRDVA